MEIRKGLFGKSDVWPTGRGGAVMENPTNGDLVTHSGRGYQNTFNKEGLPDLINWPK